ncbi:unnamed protein product [Prorocentrum cordatum]|uniref:Uncharacterized protein n=1 Tax=Prorocentrum cordatum TaxID=2364126 RepID=A0ABN9PTY8_9DINO|nr:unnamed protein product [Polarella glacialis]
MSLAEPSSVALTMPSAPPGAGRGQSTLAPVRAPAASTALPTMLTRLEAHDTRSLDVSTHVVATPRKSAAGYPAALRMDCITLRMSAAQYTVSFGALSWTQSFMDWAMARPA